MENIYNPSFQSSPSPAEKSGFYFCMAIVKSKHASDYTVIPNDVFRGNLSIEAIGLLAVLLSNKHDWVIYKTTLHSTIGMGREKLDRVFKELQENGYIVSVKKFQEGSGRFEYEHIVYDKPYNGEPLTAFPSTDNTQLINTNITSTNITSNNIKEKNIKKEKQHIENVRNQNIHAAAFDWFWSVYPTRVNKAKAKAIFMKLTENELVELKEKLLDWLKYKPFETYTPPYPETFIRNKRWQDEVNATKAQTKTYDKENPLNQW